MIKLGMTIPVEKVVWANLYGDHGCKKRLSVTDALLANPNFDDPTENTERARLLAEFGRPAAQLLAGITNLQAVVLEPTDLLLATAIVGGRFYEITREYIEVDQGIRPQTSLHKSKSDVDYVRLLRDCSLSLPPIERFDESLWSSPSAPPAYAFHRTTWTGSPNFSATPSPLDGTHRMIAVAWACDGLGREFPYLRAFLVP